MAAVSPAPTGAAALTPPGSSHGDGKWDFPGTQSEKTTLDNDGSRLDEFSRNSSAASRNGNALSAPSPQTGSHFETPARKIHPPDNLTMSKWDKAGEGYAGLPSHAMVTESRQGPSNTSGNEVAGTQSASEERRRHDQPTSGLEYSEADSKWIHRDKLAKIENEELQAAGFFVPRVRTSSKQRRPRGQNSVDIDNQHQNRQRHDSAVMDQVGEEESATPHWDLRTPAEIAEEEANAYFSSQGQKGGTKIPVAKASPAPIPQDYLDRGSPSVRRIEPMDGDTIAYTKTRSRSASATTKDFEMAHNGNRPAAAAKRSVTEGSPKKTTVRKASTGSKTSTTPSRPKTRSGPIRDASGTRPSTRSGEVSASKQPEGDPPWVFDSYKPDPRLPPDQQLIPTVAKRLQQERWEKEGKFGDAYDKEFRPLNDHEFPRPQEKEFVLAEQEDPTQAVDWPLKPSITKSPKQGSYSTMPKISDKPLVSMTANSKPPGSQPISQPQHTEPTLQAKEEAEKKKARCGCCVIM
ncbi:uncharacterized protein MAM_01350 [Metarhizium album ARSEF 1941]|uniref:TeaA receptor TeaR n=1 Tax=Metarhizium album (strain ARSEF 1941) TaxID=1081103 RepID=A0A0B2WWH6_METAS|nr:uncharacterized protein MAM_01350 [Metarhizium album ARSEF 1941]KHO00572.1 hypothetical protein MAM_01350 [Metarhizium album ARSEF 1941]